MVDNVNYEVLLLRLDNAEKALEELKANSERDRDDLKRELDEFKEREAAMERKRLSWGISTLGTVILALLSVIWTFRGDIIK